MNNNNFSISDDIWFHIADHIEPKDVKTFALISKKTYSIVQRKGFWKNLFLRHCRKGQVNWIKGLPCRYQFEKINRIGLKALRRYVIETLFYCYKPFIDKIDIGYNLDNLHNRIHVSSWYTNSGCTWIMITKFSDEAFTATSDLNQLQSLKNESIDGNIVNDWENLFEKSDIKDESISLACENEGEYLLAIICNRFLPFVSSLDLNSKTLRLTDSRERLKEDMRSVDLVLTFTGEGGSTSSIRYDNIQRYLIMPWWHPQFYLFTKQRK